MRRNDIAVFFVLMLFLSGCHQREEGLVVKRKPYEKKIYQTVKVQVGDLKPNLTLTLQESGQRIVHYRMKKGDLKLKKVCVREGEKVKKGALLVEFQSESLQQSIREYKKKIQENKLLKEHYTRLEKIDSDVDYSEEILSLKEDIRVAELYCKEAEKKQRSYEIRAKASGTITEINKNLKTGEYEAGASLIKEVCGSGIYRAETDDSYPFQKGDVFLAKVGAASCRMRLVKIQKKKAESGRGFTTLLFQSESDMSMISDGQKISVVISKPEIKNVVYVDTKAVYRGEGEDYVYCLDENGYRDAVIVKTGDVVGNYTVVSEGLSGGETVTVKEG